MNNALWRAAGLAVLWCGPVLAQQYGPNIVDFNPKVGAPGDMVIISGSGFTSGRMTVRFPNGLGCGNGVVAAIYTNSDTQLTATVPAGVATGLISIQQDSLPATCPPIIFTAIGTGPYIADVQPRYGDTNLYSYVIISGVHLLGTAPNGVQFNGTNSANALVNANGTMLTVNVPYGTPPGSAPVRVTTTLGSSNSPVPFTVVGPGPFITGFSPVMGSAGQTVLLDGMHFTGVTNATFDGVRAASFIVQSDTRMTLAAPSGVTTGPIAVSGPLGTFSTTSNFFVAPTISGFSPANGRPGTNVTIIGSNFRGATNVSFNGLPCAGFTVVNQTNIQATVPSGVTTGILGLSTPGFVCFSSNKFTVQPTITGFTPPFGPAGTSVTLTGANFNASGLAVRFSGVPAASVTGVTFGQLRAVVPQGASTGPISLSTVDGSHTNKTLFYLPAGFGNFSPSTGPAGTRVTITGQNFLGATKVAFNGAPADSFTVTNNSLLGATVPAGVTTGPISVTVPANTTTSSALFYGAPLISGYFPTHGLPGTNVIISGTNFLGATAVRFAGTTASVVSVDNGTIVATVPFGARTGHISVEAPGGTNTSGGSFVLDYTSDVQVWMTNFPNPVTVGSNLSYQVTVVNNGPFSAANVMLTNILPLSADLAAASLSKGVLVTNGNLLIGNLGQIDPGGFGSMLLSVVPRTTGTLVDSATVGSDYPDPLPANNSFSSFTTVLPLPILAIELFSSNQVRLSWPVALTNFILQSTPSLMTNAFWSNINAAPIIAGAQRSVLQTNAGTRRFYRLSE